MKNQIMVRSNIQVLYLALSISVSSLPTFAALEPVGSGEMSPIDEQLFKAIEENKPQDVERLLNEGARVDVRNGFSYMPLHRAAASRNLEIVRLLIEKNAPLEARTNLNCTPLYCAVDTFISQPADLVESAKVVRFFLSKNASKIKRNFQGFTLLHAAIIQNNGVMIDILLNAGINKEATTRKGLKPLELAVEMSNAESVSTLLRAGFQANVNILQRALRTDFRPQKGDAALHMLLLHDTKLLSSDECCKLLTSHHFDLTTFKKNKARFTLYWQELKDLLQTHYNMPLVLADLIWEYHNCFELYACFFPQVKSS